MLAYVIRRIIQTLLVMLAMAILVFVSVYALGDPVDVLISPEADQLERARVTSQLGLDRPLIIQFGIFLTRLAEGDLGRSFVHGAPAIQVVLARLPATLELAVGALIIALLV